MATAIKVSDNPTKKELEEFKKKLEKLPGKKASKHFGKMKWPMDGLEYQKMMRNEWA